MEVEKYFENLASMLIKEGEQDLASVQTSKESESNESNLHNEEDENVKNKYKALGPTHVWQDIYFILLNN